MKRDRSQKHPRRQNRAACLLAALAVFCCLLAAPLMTAAQSTAANATFTVAIAAGPLEEALNSFAVQTGLTLSFSPELVEQMDSAGLNGTYRIEDGLSALLDEHGLRAVRRENGSYTLEEDIAPGQDGEEAPAIEVTASSLDDTTEGSGSYTTGLTTTATKMGLSIRETPQSISVMTNQRIEDQGLSSLSEVIEQTPGLNIQNLGSERFTIYSRGYTINDYQLDGVSTHGISSTQAIPQGLADLATYDHVEVVRGATGLMLGAGDPSGIINLVRKKPTHEFQGNVIAELGSWDHYRAQLDVGGPLTKNGRVRGRLVGVYQDNNSYMDAYELEKQVYYGILEADVTDTTLVTVGFDYQENDPQGSASTGFPLFYDDGRQTDFSRSTNPAASWSSDHKTTYNTFASLEQKLTDHWQLNLAANYMSLDRDFSSATAAWGFLDEETGEGIKLYGAPGDTDQTQTGVEMRLEGSYTLLGREHDLVAGFSFSKYENNHMPLYRSGVEGTEINFYTWNHETARPDTGNGKLYDLDTIIYQRGFYLASRLNPLERLHLILGGRVSDYSYDYSLHYVPETLTANNKTTKYSEHGEITPYFGLVYDLTETHSLYASYTSIFQPQSYHDRNGDALDPKTGDHYEVGVKSEFFAGRINASLALFEIRQDNLAEVDSGYTVPGTTTSAYRAVEGAKTQGVDVELSGEIIPGWHVMASYSYSLTEDADGSRLATEAPRQMAKLWTTYQWRQLTVGGGVNWQSRIYFSTTSWQLPDVPLEAEQDAYTVVDLMARYQLTDTLCATLNVNNLFDKKYLSSLDSTFFTGYYGEPRSVLLSLRYDF
nr:TonB-dependent siderophore receptor [uncultured Desulfuromonas sp.]